MNDNHETLVQLTAEITAAHLSHNPVPVTEVAGLITGIYGALAALGQPEKPVAPEFVPAVSIKSSVKPDHVVCLECGAKHKMLKRHLMTEHGLTPDEYRARYGLAADHPLVAPNYANVRRDLAKAIGLGRKPGQRRGRHKKAA